MRLKVSKDISVLLSVNLIYSNKVSEYDINNKSNAKKKIFIKIKSKDENKIYIYQFIFQKLPIFLRKKFDENKSESLLDYSSCFTLSYYIQF